MWPWSRIRELEERLSEAKADAARWQTSSHERGDEIARLLGELNRALDLYNGAVQKLVELKRLGFEVPPPPGAAIPAEGELPELVMDAIEERAEPGTPLWNTLKQWAARQLRQDRPDDDVADEILQGGEVEV